MTSRLLRPWLLVGLAVLSAGCNCGTVRLGQTRLTLDVDPDALDFGTLRVGQSAARTVTLTNVSSASIAIERPELVGDASSQFSSSPNGGRFELRPGQSFAIDVIYQPAAAGSHAARLQVSTSATSSPELLLPVVGVALADCNGARCDAPDSGDADSGVLDAGPVDAGAPDSGTPDAGEVDSGVPDAGPSDQLGACGSANASEVTTSPDPSTLCSSGTPSTLSGSGPWSWTCEGAQQTATCSTGLFLLTHAHEELRTVPLGRPNGAQRFASTITRTEFINNSASTVTVRIVPRDAQARFMWSSGVPMSTLPEVSGQVLTGGRISSTLLWNSGDDTGTASDPCGRNSQAVGVEYWVGSSMVAFLSIHAQARQPFTCPGGLVTWSSTTPNAGGPCRAMLPPRLENLASSDPLEVQSTTADSDPGYSGAQGWTCNAATFATDACGAVVPVTGQPLMTYARNAGPMACSGP